MWPIKMHGSSRVAFNEHSNWWLVELPMWLMDSFLDTFLEGGGEQCAYM